MTVYSVLFCKVRSAKMYYFDRARKALKSFCLAFFCEKNVIITQISQRSKKFLIAAY